ncbi:MAG: HD domain-containing protein [Terracidiphilus sp.]|jgi:uncharacterized protein
MTEPWRTSVIEYIRAEALPADKFGHQPRLYALAAKLGEGMEFDDDILFAAAWMHDLGVFLGHRPQDPAELARWNHVPYTVARSRELLAGWGFPNEKLDGVAEAIRTHQPQDEPVTVEATLLRDADILEQLGAIGALRALVKVGRDTRYPTYSSVLPVLQNAAERLPELLRLERARELAGPRVGVLRTLIAAIEAEADGALY